MASSDKTDKQRGATSSQVRSRVLGHLRRLLIPGVMGLGACKGTEPAPVVCDPMPPPADAEPPQDHPDAQPPPVVCDPMPAPVEKPPAPKKK